MTADCKSCKPPKRVNGFQQTFALMTQIDASLWMENLLGSAQVQSSYCYMFRVGALFQSQCIYSKLNTMKYEAK